MQSVGTYRAEDSCFIKYHPSNSDSNDNDRPNDQGVEPQTLDVEKGGVDPSVAASSGPNNINTTGIFTPPPIPGSDNSTLHNEDEDDKDDFPEGGLRAWSVVFGSFCGSFSVFGIINSTAILLEYFQQHQLQAYSPSQIGWIFGLSLFLTFFCGAPIGPIFDAYGPRVLVFCGSILLVASMFLLGLCTRTSPYF